MPKQDTIFPPDVIAPPACRCGEPATRMLDRGRHQDQLPICESCWHKDGHDAQLVPVETPLPADPLTMAIAKGMGAGEIASIVGLIREREQDEAKRRFSEAMVAAQAEMPVVVRDAKNTQTNSGYATLENVNKTAKPVYSRHGFALSFSEADTKIEHWKRTVCVVRHVGGHSEEHFVDLPVDGIGPKGNPIGGMNSVQGAISTGSYGQRVLLCRIFNIVLASSDVDGQSLSDLLNITPEQQSDLRELVIQNEMDEAKLLKWLGAPSIEQITRKQYEKFQSTYRQRKKVAS